jgi:hypothetical protein
MTLVTTSYTPSTQTITPFYEKALLNKTALDILCPPDVFKTPFEQDGKPLLNVLYESRHKTLIVNKRFIHSVGKPFRYVATLVYIMAVTVILSPIAGFDHASLALIKLSKYCFIKYTKKNRDQKELWIDIVELIKVATKEIFKGIESLFVISQFRLALFSTDCLIYLTKTNPILVLLSSPLYSLLIAAPCILHKIAQTSSFIGFFAATSVTKNRNEIDFALYLRDKFGLVDKNGELLKFSKKDGLAFDKTDPSYQGNPYSLLREILINYLHNILIIKNDLNQKQTSDSTEKLKIELESYEHKTRSMFFLFMYKDLPRNLKETDQDCKEILKNLNEKSLYRNQFYKKLTVKALNPSDSKNPQENTLAYYDEKLRIAKFNNQPLHEIFDLKEKFKEDELNTAYRKYFLCIHPDKNRNNQTLAQTLVNDYGLIIDQLRASL